MEQIKRNILNSLIFLRIVDNHDQMISISNIALIIVLVKLTMAPQANLTDTGTLLIALANYSYKKYINKDAGTNSPT